MADPQLVKILRQGSDVWNDWREQISDQIKIDLCDTDLSSIHLSEADLHQACLDKTMLIDADLSYSNLRDANLTQANLQNADLSYAKLNWAHLDEANLNQAILYQTDLRDADLSDADLTKANLSGAKLQGVNLIDSDLSEADLTEADLAEAYLIGANLSRATLKRAKLIRTNLVDANLYATDLREANLAGANLIGANLAMARLYGADLHGIKVGDTIFARINLRNVKGLSEVDHQRSSDVALHTIKLPQDGSALHFLRGTGIPDEWIDFYRSTMIHPIQYHSCFISYSSKDDVLAHRLYTDLQAHGVRCWFAPEDLKPGNIIRDHIDRAIHMQDKLLLLLSQYAIASDWVEDEVEAAIEKERKQEREVLFPIRLDASVMQTSKAWAAKLRRTRHIGDFTQWTNPSAYQQAFDRLLRDLKRENK